MFGRTDTAEESLQQATYEDFQQLFTEQMGPLHTLAYLLTADPALAEACFVAGLEDSMDGNLVFRQWARSWGATRDYPQRGPHVSATGRVQRGRHQTLPAAGKNLRPARIAARSCHRPPDLRALCLRDLGSGRTFAQRHGLVARVHQHSAFNSTGARAPTNRRTAERDGFPPSGRCSTATLVLAAGNCLKRAIAFSSFHPIELLKSLNKSCCTLHFWTLARPSYLA